MKRFAKDTPDRKCEKRSRHGNDDLWGDSDSDIDDFLASQFVDEIEKNPVVDVSQAVNDSLINYNAFNKTSMLASTQMSSTNWAHPSTTSRIVLNQQVIHNNKHDEENEVKQLREQIFYKEGEISILRTQLKQVKEQADITNSKRMNETLDKLQTVRKDRDKISTELDFKNMEIINLKRKIENITRNFLENSSVNSTDTSKLPEATLISSFKQEDIWEEIIEPLSFTRFPLKLVIPVNIFHSFGDDKFPKTIHSKQPVDERFNVHSSMFFNYHDQQEKAVYTYVHFRKSLKIRHFFETIRLIRDASNWELENDTNWVYQIYMLTLVLVSNQLEYLTKFEGLVHVDEIREIDKRNIQNANGLTSMINISLLEPTNCDNSIEECAIQCRQCLALLAALYPCNKYLRNVINSNKLPQVSERDREGWPFAFNDVFTVGNDVNLLMILYKVVKIIGKIRRGNLYVGFLCSISELLTGIITFYEENLKAIEVVAKIVTEILLSTPSHLVLLYLSKLFKYGSTCLPFLELLCKSPSSNVKKIKKDLVWINSNCCIIDIYFNCCRQVLPYMKDFEMHLNLVEFITNSIDLDVRWMYFEADRKHYDCQKEYYKVALEILYSTLKQYSKLQQSGGKMPVEGLTIVRTSTKILATLIRKYNGHIDNSMQYSALMKSCKSLLQRLQSRFDGWNDFDEELIGKLIISEAVSLPTRASWNQINLNFSKP